MFIKIILGEEERLEDISYNFSDKENRDNMFFHKNGEKVHQWSKFKSSSQVFSVFGIITTGDQQTLLMSICHILLYSIFPSIRYPNQIFS